MNSKKNQHIKIIIELEKIIKKINKKEEIAPSFKIILLQLNKEIKAFLSFWKNKSKKKYINPKLENLQIGGGKHYLKGFINLDLFKPADIIWDCRYGLPFPSNKFKMVFTEHFLEHLDFPSSIKLILKEIYRVLKPKGELFIGVPDAEKIIKAYYRNEIFFMNKLKVLFKKRKPKIEVFGNIDLVNYFLRDQIENPDYTIHYWAYDESSLKNLLKSIGFKKVVKTKFNPKYCNPKRSFYTLYIKAIK